MSLKRSLNKPPVPCVDETGLAYVKNCHYCWGLRHRTQRNPLKEMNYDTECPWRPSDHFRAHGGRQISSKQRLPNFQSWLYSCPSLLPSSPQLRALLVKLTFQLAPPGEGCPGTSSSPSMLCQRLPRSLGRSLCPWAKMAVTEHI